MSSFLEYLKKKRNSLCRKGKRSLRSCNMLNSIRMTKKGEFVKISVCDERDAHNVRAWLSNNKKYLCSEAVNISTTYKREESILYVYIR